MSETTLQPGLGNGLDRIGQLVDSLFRRLELARLERVSASQDRILANLIEEIVAVMHRQVAMCDSRLSDMKSFWILMWKSVGRVPESTWNSGGRELQVFFDASITDMELARTHVESCERIVGRPLGLERIHQVLAEARQMRKDLETNWLWFTKEAEDEAKASIARGEGVDVEEAFAEMMGLPMEELRAKMEAHRRKYHPSGNGAR